MAAMSDRIILHLPGRLLRGNEKCGICFDVLNQVAEEIRLGRLGGIIKLGVVVGGSNFINGQELVDKEDFDESHAHMMGMQATVINALALEERLLSREPEIPTSIMPAIEMEHIGEKFTYRKAVNRIDRHQVVIFAVGVGNAGLSTYAAAVLRAAEMSATKVVIASTESQEQRLSTSEAMALKSPILDPTTLIMARERKLPLMIINGRVPGNISRAIQGKEFGTVISDS